MSEDQGRMEIDLKQMQVPATKEEQKIDPTELTDEDLGKVAGGALPLKTAPLPNKIFKTSGMPGGTAPSSQLFQMGAGLAAGDNSGAVTFEGAAPIKH